MQKSPNNKINNSAYDPYQEGHEGGYSVFSDLSRERKIAVISLAVFSFIFFIMWGVYIKHLVYSPTNKIIAEDNIENTQNFEDALRLIDTDGDSLSDWEEINLYNTSPYLEDTDGDSISDDMEIAQNNDPNCSKEDGCDLSNISNESYVDNTQQIIETFAEENINIDVNTEDVDSLEDNGTLSSVLDGAGDAATLRKMLLDAGMDSTILETISDEDLLSSYEQILQ